VVAGAKTCWVDHAFDAAKDIVCWGEKKGSVTKATIEKKGSVQGDPLISLIFLKINKAKTN